MTTITDAPETTTDSTVESDTTVEISLADLARTVAAADAVERAIKDRVLDTRAAVLRRLVGMRRDTGVKSIDVLLDPDDPKSKVASIALANNDEKIAITNEDEYTAWVEQQYGELGVEFIVRVRPSFRAMHEKELVIQDGLVVDPKFHQVNAETGELIADGTVAGARVIPGGDPKSFRLTFAKATKKDPDADGRERTLAALFPNGDVAAVLTGRTDTIIEG